MNSYESTCQVVQDQACELIEQGVPADTLADALVTQGLAVWAADAGSAERAAVFAALWSTLREGR